MTTYVSDPLAGDASSNSAHPDSGAATNRSPADTPTAGSPAAVAALREIKRAVDEHSIVAITDSAGRITYVNEKFCAISKYSAEELIGRDHRVINSGVHSREFFRELWRTIRAGKTWKGEICNRAKDGRLYWVETTIMPVLDGSGQAEHYIAIRTDVTPLRLAEESLRRSETRLRETQALTECGAWELNLVEREALWTEAALGIFEIDPNRFEPDYRSFLKLVHPEDREPLREKYERSLSDRMPYQSVHRLAFSHGRVKYIEEHGRTECGPDGRPVRSIGTVRDVTEPKEREIALRESEKWAATGRVATIIAHEINNPLNGISLLTRMLMESASLSENDSRYLKTVNRELARITTILSRMHSAFNPPWQETREFCVQEIFEDFARIFEPDCRARTVGLNIELPPRSECMVRLREAAFSQILQNLARNALDASPPGGTVGLRFSSGPDAKEVSLEVSDQGAGIPAEIQGKIFEPFFTTKRADGRSGAGLGLSIVRGLVEAMHGSIACSSEPGIKTTFVVKLPRSLPESGPSSLPSEHDF